MNLQVLNQNWQNKPNILHFPGTSILKLEEYFNSIYSYVEIENKNIEDLTILSVWTDEARCAVKHQCDRYGINIINVVPEDYDKTQKWNMTFKIKFILDALKNVTTKYVLILDGYDVLLNELSTIVEKFEKQEYDILFNASANNYPNLLIDMIPIRYLMGDHCYLNAGCCIGKKESLISFYTDAEELNKSMRNIFSSEQYLIRHVFKKYSSDPKQRFVFIDYKSTIFQVMSAVNGQNYKDKEGDKYTILIDDQNVYTPTYAVIGCCSDIGSKLTDELFKSRDSRTYCFDDEMGNNILDAVGLLKNTRVDTVFHIANDEDIAFLQYLEYVCNHSGCKLVVVLKSDMNDESETSRNNPYVTYFKDNEEDLINKLLMYTKKAEE